MSFEKQRVVSCYGHLLTNIGFIYYFDYKSADCHQPLIILGSDSLFVYAYFFLPVLSLVGYINVELQLDAIFQQLKQPLYKHRECLYISSC